MTIEYVITHTTETPYDEPCTGTHPSFVDLYAALDEFGKYMNAILWVGNYVSGWKPIARMRYGFRDIEPELPYVKVPSYMSVENKSLSETWII